mmetsp:Transcript_33717/g.67135  ORF Transcript_33717/g.67135 Transcript_33717/m.67135 type:complete len:473 (+) Transcript_33717:73-1491(+)
MEIAAECSTKVPSEAAGRIRWTIERWAALPSKQGESTCSTVMDCAGEHWQLEVYPGGDAEESGDTPEVKAQRNEHVAAYIWYKGPSTSAKTKFTLRLANQLGKTDKTIIGHTVFSGLQPQPPDTFDALGSHMLVKRDVLEDETYGFKINDRVLIEADITTYGGLVTTAEKPVLFEPSETLKTDLSHLLSTGNFSDVTVTIPPDDHNSSSSSFSSSSSSPSHDSRASRSATTKDGDEDSERTFHLHSQILKARSPYFRAMLSAPMAESLSLQITECDVQVGVFKEVVKYMYTDALSEGAPEEMGEWLLLAANKYGLEALKQLCEAGLCRGLEAGNAAVRLVLSDQAMADELKEACLSFIKGKAAQVMQTEGWGQVAAHRQGALAMEVLQAVAGVPKQFGGGSGKKRSAAALDALDGTSGLGEKKMAAAADAVDEMSVSALRSALTRRSLDTSGLKTQLVDRLKAAVQSSPDNY